MRSSYLGEDVKAHLSMVSTVEEEKVEEQKELKAKEFEISIS